MRLEPMTLVGQSALVVAPEQHIRLGRDRLVRLREFQGMSDVDRMILAAADTAPPDIMILRGKNDDGTGSWAFDGMLTTSECQELGYLLVRSQLPLWRALAKRGVYLFVKVEWGPHEIDAYLHGAQRVLDALDRKLEEEESALAVLDRWMIRNLSHWLLATFEDCRESFLPSVVKRSAARRAKLEKLLAAVPEGAIA